MRKEAALQRRLYLTAEKKHKPHPPKKKTHLEFYVLLYMSRCRTHHFYEKIYPF